jgi:hypothetical protein
MDALEGPVPDELRSKADQFRIGFESAVSMFDVASLVTGKWFMDYRDALARSAESRVLSPIIWVSFYDIVSYLRSSLEWSAYAIRLRYDRGVEKGRRSVTFPTPRSTQPWSPVQLSEMFPNLESDSSGLFDYLVSVATNKGGGYGCLAQLHEMWNEMKHRQPLQTQVESLHVTSQDKEGGTAESVTSSWLIAIAENFKINDIPKFVREEMFSVKDVLVGIKSVSPELAQVSRAWMDYSRDPPKQP